MKKVTGLVLDDQHWAALLELVGARVVDLRGYHGLREDFEKGLGQFNVIWPADPKLQAVFAQLARMGLPPPEVLDGWEAEYVSRDAAAAAGVPRASVSGDWGGCASEACPLCQHRSPLGFFVEEADATLVERTAEKVKAANPSFDPATDPLTGDDGDPDALGGSPAPAPSMRSPAPPAGIAGDPRSRAPAAQGSGIVLAGSATPVVEKEPEPVGPPLEAAEIRGRIVLRIPTERWSMELATRIGARDPSVVRGGDTVSGQQLDRLAREGAGFVTVLPYFSEVFLDGKPLDKKRFEAEAKELEAGVRSLEALLPRFGAVRVLVSAKGKFLTSEITGPAAELLALFR